MSSALDGLTAELEGHLELYERLLATLETEKKALLKSDLGALNESTQAKTAAAHEIQASAERLRARLLQAARALGLAAEPAPVLPALAQAAPEPFRRGLARAAGRLARLKNDLALKNAANRAFINEALSLVNGSVAILTGAKQLKGSGYTAAGLESRPLHTRPVKLSREV